MLLGIQHQWAVFRSEDLSFVSVHVVISTLATNLSIVFEWQLWLVFYDWKLKVHSGTSQASIYIIAIVIHFVFTISHGAGIDKKGLPEDLDCHHLIVNDMADIEKTQNVCIVSIPTVFNPKLAPEGKHLIHAYCAANEPYSNWEGMDRKSKEYKDLKVTCRYTIIWKQSCMALSNLALPSFAALGTHRNRMIINNQ